MSTLANTWELRKPLSCNFRLERAKSSARLAHTTMLGGIPMTVVRAQGFLMFRCGMASLNDTRNEMS